MAIFSRQTRLQIREMVGHLTGYGRIDTVRAGAVSPNSLSGYIGDYAKLRPDDGLVGMLAYVADGAGAGQIRTITGSQQSSGSVSVTPSWSVQPDVGSRIELWDSAYPPDRVNDLINTAILNVQEYTLVRKRDHPSSIDSDGKFLTVPATFKYVSRLVYENQTPPPPFFTYEIGRDTGWFYESERSARLSGNLLYLYPYLDTDIAADPTKVWIEGHGIPDVLSADTDYADVRAEYLVFYTGFLLEAGESAGNNLDPEEHGGRAGNWLREAITARQGMFDPPDPNSVEVGP